MKTIAFEKSYPLLEEGCLFSSNQKSENILNLRGLWHFLQTFILEAEQNRILTSMFKSQKVYWGGFKRHTSLNLRRKPYMLFVGSTADIFEKHLRNKSNLASL